MAKQPFARYSVAQIALHWLVVALVVEQYATSGAILRTHAYRPLGQRPDPFDLTLHSIHTRVGLVIFALVALRVGLRLLHGAPAWATAPPLLRRRLAAGVQYGLCGVLLAQAATGAVASYLWWPMSAAHKALFVALLALLAAHLAGAALSLATRPRETLYRITGAPAPAPESIQRGDASRAATPQSRSKRDSMTLPFARSHVPAGARSTSTQCAPSHNHSEIDKCK